MLRPTLLAAMAVFGACSAGPPAMDGSPPRSGESATPRASFSGVTVRWDYGPCDPNDARSCHQAVSVTADGRMLQTETPNPGVSPTPKTRTSALAPAELEAIKGIVDEAFVRQMKAGFPCSRPTPDASVTIVVEVDGRELSQDVTPCVRDAAPNPAQKLVSILDPYRFVR